MSKISYEIDNIDNILLKIDYNNIPFGICIKPIAIACLFLYVVDTINVTYRTSIYIGSDVIDSDIDYFIIINENYSISVYSDSDVSPYDEDTELQEKAFIKFDEKTSNMIFNTLYKLLVLYYESGKYKTNDDFEFEHIDMDELIQKINNIFK